MAANDVQIGAGDHAVAVEIARDRASDVDQRIDFGLGKQSGIEIDFIQDTGHLRAVGGAATENEVGRSLNAAGGAGVVNRDRNAVDPQGRSQRRVDLKLVEREGDVVEFADGEHLFGASDEHIRAVLLHADDQFAHTVFERIDRDVIAVLVVFQSRKDPRIDARILGQIDPHGGGELVRDVEIGRRVGRSGTGFPVGAQFQPVPGNGRDDRRLAIERHVVAADGIGTVRVKRPGRL